MIRATTAMTRTLLSRTSIALPPVHIAARRARWDNVPCSCGAPGADSGSAVRSRAIKDRSLSALANVYTIAESAALGRIFPVSYASKWPNRRPNDAQNAQNSAGEFLGY